VAKRDNTILLVIEYLEYLKIKLETSLFAVKLYGLKNNLYAKYMQWKPRV